VPAAIAVFTFIVCWVILGRTKFGRFTYAIGGNEEAARLSGINVVRFKGFVYTFCGLMSGLAGVVLTSRVNSGQPLLGAGFEMEAIAAVVIGGVSIGGGAGSIGGVLIGVLLMSVIWNGLNLANVSSFVQLMAIGAIIVLAVSLDRLRHRKEE
jgi:ribose transport system permease protein